MQFKFRYLLFFILIGCSISNDTNERKQLSNNEISTSLRVDLLRNNILDTSSSDLFFKSFPCDFIDFKEIFGFQEYTEDSIMYGMLYKDAEMYIEAFFNNKKHINEPFFLKKSSAINPQ